MSTAILAPKSTTAQDTTSSRALTADECRSWLTTHGEGRLGYLSGRGERKVVVTYAVGDDEIVLRVPAYNEIAQYGPGRQVTLEVTGCTDDEELERVAVTGRASVRPNVPDAVLRRLPDEHWPDGLSNILVSVPLEKIAGQVVVRCDHADGPTAR